MKEEKRNLHKDEGALRIMEALSAVDEELLERSGMPLAEVLEGKQNTRKVTYMSLYKNITSKIGRYGRMAAAFLAIVVVGAISWGGLRLNRMITGDSESSGFSGGAQPGGTAANQETAQEMTAGGSMYTDTDVTSEGNNGAEYADSEAYTELEIITEEQARDLELGAYLPQRMPAGYSFESARIDDKGQLYLCWTHGKDAIWLSVTYVEAGELETVDINRPETYDVRLYELPYEETVPQEYWAVFDNPIFMAADFSLETVASRMKSYEDAKDTDTPSGSFSILCPDGVLVGFDGDGSVEDIWTMFEFLQE